MIDIQETLLLGPNTPVSLSHNQSPQWASLVAQLVKNLPAMQETWA